MDSGTAASSEREGGPAPDQAGGDGRGVATATLGPAITERAAEGADAAPAGADGSGAPPHLSPSSASTFTSCPRRWRFRYVDRLPDPPGLAALAGTLVHRVLERLLADAPEARSLERAKALASEEWADHAALPDLVRFALGPEGTRAYKWRVWRAVTGLWDLEDPASVQVAATEQRLEVDLAGVPFLGVVDRVDRAADGLVVTDYKSGRLPAPSHRQEKLEQVLLYAAAVATDGEEAPRRRLLYLGAEVIEVETSATAMAAAVDRLRDRWDEVQSCLASDEFPARTGPLCAWCPYAERCPEGRREVLARYEAGMVSIDAPALRLVA